MKPYFNTFFFLFFIISVTLHAQLKSKEIETYGLKYDPFKPNRACIACLQTLSQMPPEVHFGLVRVENAIVFVMNDKQWFNAIFNDKDDGIAVDIIQKKQFQCGRNNDYNKNSFVKGILTKPVFLKQINKTNLQYEGMEVVVPVAAVPDELLSQTDLEYNLVVIKNDEVCYYNSFYNLPGSKLSLLQMDLFLDTIAQTNLNGKQGQFTLDKKFEFTIPFEKNKSEYKPEDFIPIRDSLRLNTYDIQSIEIKAYSSVEGPLEKNIELQEKRAESIVKSLQSFQKEEIKYDVHASENWVEFLADINSPHLLYLKTLTKEEVKKELEKKQVIDNLEVILKKHRKALLYIKLEKKSNYFNATAEQIVKEFTQAINSNNLKTALEIQEAIFHNIEVKKYEPSLIKELTVPEKSEFGSIMFNNFVFENEKIDHDDAATLNNFLRLEPLMPANILIKYNIAALQVKLLGSNELIADRAKVYNDIRTLEKMNKIDNRLIKRLLVNYHMILCEYLMAEKNYIEKNKSLQYIYSNYKNLKLTDEDLVRLAQYFTIFGRSDWALNAIESRVRSLNVSEDLLFYFINLTITDDKNTSKANYRSVLLNAYNLNAKRFCKMFDTSSTFGDLDSGISFQILKDPYLKKSYCENCGKSKK